jgi:hypothetical protein
LLASVFIGTGVANAQSVSDDFVNGVKLRGDGSIDNTRPGVSGRIGPNDTLEAKLAKLELQRAQREVQRERVLAGLPADGPQREKIEAQFERKLVQLDTKQARIEARVGDDSAVADVVRREDRRAERVERAERPERTERAERPERTEKMERSRRG